MTVHPQVEKVDRAGIIDIASKLIAVPSPSGDEKAVMDFVTQWCDQRGLRYTIVANDPMRPNVIVSIGDPGIRANDRDERPPRYRASFRSRQVANRSV